MDCRFFNENIDLFVDGLLSDSDRRQFLEHAASCISCQKALDDALRIKNALAALGDLEPPEGLAKSAIQKAKKKKPLFAYVSGAAAAAAAVIALAVILTTGPKNDGMTRFADENTMSAMIAPQQAAEAAPEAAGGAVSEEPEAEQDMVGKAAGFSAEESVERGQAPSVYASEEDFAAGEQSSYYKPAALPDGAALQSVTVYDESIIFTYSLEDGRPFVFEWLDALDENGLADWLKTTYGDLSELKFDGTYYTISAGDATDVYWQQDGDAFHAVLPKGMDVAEYGSAQFVKVEPQE